MPQGRILWRGPRLTRLPASPPAITTNSTLPQLRRPTRDPPIRPRPAVGQRRWLASVNIADSNTSSTPSVSLLQDSSFVSWFPDSTIAKDEAGKLRLSPLDHLLRAIQFRDVPRILPSFIRWTQAMKSSNKRVTELALDELRELPAETFSEILRWVDPVANSSQDIAHGLNITRGQTHYNETAMYADNFGVRVHNRALLDSAKVIMDARRSTGRKMLIQDYEICLRIAGAASDPDAAVIFFGAIAKDGLGHYRTTATWTEFTKALFLLDPVYYQFDRSRVAILARQLYSNRTPVSPPDLWRMERMRYSIEALKFKPFNRSRHRISQDLRMKSRNKMRARGHWTRAVMYGVLINEEFKCAHMMAYGRASALASLRGNILWRGFRLKFKEDRETGEVTVSGGKFFRPGNPREPTERLLDAIVETFGSMSRIRTGLKLLVWSSYKWDIPIPHKTWSSMLHWAYVSASKPFRRMRRLQGRYMVHSINAKDIMEIWKVMTMEPFNVKPTFDDYGVYIKALIFQRNFRTAIDIIRKEAVPFYRRIQEEHYNLVEDEVLRGITEPTYQRNQIELKKEYVWWNITSWFSALLKAASSGRFQREGEFAQVEIPNLIAEFGEFFMPSVKYRTAQGRVVLIRPFTTSHSRLFREERLTLPQDMGGMIVRSKENRGYLSMQDPDFKWPQISQLKVQRWRRLPNIRPRASGVAPDTNDASGHEWWEKLYRELRI